MRKYIWLLFIALVPFFSAQALDSLGGFVIENYDTKIELARDASFIVTETIEVDFFEERHGIFREIPFKYKDDNGFRHNFRYEVSSVADERGDGWPFKQYKEGGNLVLKIGSPNQLVSGRQVYVIRYRVRGGMRFFDDHSEFYWNAIGVNWPTTVEKGKSSIILPNDLELGNDDLVCYTGPAESRRQACVGAIISSRQVNFSLTEPLGVYEGLTLAVKFPLDFIPKPAPKEVIGFWFLDNWGFLIPGGTLLLMFFLWRKFGREIDLGRTVIVQYEPPDQLTPGELAYLMKENYSADQVAADLVNLAVKGYLKIEELPKKILRKQDYLLTKLKDYDNSPLKQHEKDLLGGLFRHRNGSVKFSQLKSFYLAVDRAKEALAIQIGARGYFIQGARNSRLVYVIPGTLLGAILFFSGITTQRPDFVVAGIASALIVVIFGIFMSKKTQKGAEAYWHSRGFGEYIKTAERYRVKFQEQQNLFEKFLPYAMVFGLADKWSKAFEGIIQVPPDWYVPASGQTFSLVTFSSSLDGFSARAASFAAPPSSSSSSGFGGGGGSGGGGGGGGGGEVGE